VESGKDERGQGEEKFEKETKAGETEVETGERKGKRDNENGQIREEAQLEEERTHEEEQRVEKARERTETTESGSEEKESYEQIQMEVVRLQRQKLLMEVSVLKKKESERSTENVNSLEKSGLGKAFLSVFETCRIRALSWMSIVEWGMCQ
jgi:hypothetical protein